MKTTSTFEAGDLAAFNGRNGDTYVVSAGKDGHLYCSCPAWKFQRSHPSDRMCKHIQEFVSTVTREEIGQVRK